MDSPLFRLGVKVGVSRNGIISLPSPSSIGRLRTCFISLILPLQIMLLIKVIITISNIINIVRVP